MRTAFLSLTCLLALNGCGGTTLVADPSKSCSNCERWNVPQKPFSVFANSYYVGTTELTAILIASTDGHILIDGGLAQSAPLIADNIEQLGYSLKDVKLLLNSHAHYDHAGGLAALARASGARVMASPQAALALAQGGPGSDDPQFGFGAKANSFPALANIEVIEDKQVLRVGPLAITAHFTPGHSAGGTSWSWRSCNATQCADIVYADSVNPVSTREFRYSDSTSEFVNFASVRRSAATIAQLPCDVLLSPHPFYFDMNDKLKRLENTPASNPFVDAAGCRNYASDILQRLEKRISQEKDHQQK